MTAIRDRLVQYLAGGTIEARVSGAVAEAVASTETRLRAESDARVREALSAAMTRGDQHLMEQGFRRLTHERNLRDLTPLAQDRMLHLGHWLWESNPLAQWLVEVTVDFVWGEGGVVKAEDPKVQDVIDEFWGDPVNQLALRMDDFTRDLGIDGELVLPVFANEWDGHVRLGFVDPLQIDDVIVSADNALIPEIVVLKGLGTERKRYLHVVRSPLSRAEAHYGKLMPAKASDRVPFTGRHYDGSCLLFQVNKRSGARRGRSDLLSLIDWLDGYDAFLFDSMDKAQLQGSFVWDVELQDMNEPEIEAWLQKNQRVRPGMVRAHNQRVKWSAVAPDLKSHETEKFARTLRGQMMGSRSLPLHFYGDGSDANLATAKEMALPTVKRMSRRQRVVKHIMVTLARFAVHQAKVAGRLPKDADETMSAELPELAIRDTTSITSALTQLAVALSQAETQGWIRRETSARLFGLLASQLGSEIKPEDEVTPEGVPTPTQGRDYDPAKVRSLIDRLEQRMQGDSE